MIEMVERESGAETGMKKTLSNMVLDFFESEDQAQLSSPAKWIEDDDGDDSEVDVEETRAFWEEQHQLLQEALSKKSSIETRIATDTEEAIKKLRSAGSTCTCSKECRQNCQLESVADRLRDIGYNSAVCKSKWRKYLDIPSGDHTFVDVMVESKSRKKGPTRIVIELNFRPEFEMARANSEYNKLVSRLPEVFVGKSDKLRNVIRIMCESAKRCMKDNRMHLAPWRKHKYMQSKWLGTCERISPGPTVRPDPASEESRPSAKPRASMLTFDFSRTAVAVV